MDSMVKRKSHATWLPSARDMHRTPVFTICSPTTLLSTYTSTWQPCYDGHMMPTPASLTARDAGKHCRVMCIYLEVGVVPEKPCDGFADQVHIARLLAISPDNQLAPREVVPQPIELPAQDISHSMSCCLQATPYYLTSPEIFLHAPPHT